VKLVGLPCDAFIRHGEARAQRAALGLDAAGIRRTVEGLLAS
jgi:1-deoxy-D-xylulose-5-phosphate synthase